MGDGRSGVGVSDLVVEFERSGGFAGITLTTRVHVTDLPTAQAVELERLLAAAGTPASNEPDGQPDRFRYRIRPCGSADGCEVHLAEESLSPEEARLVDCLTDIARRPRASGDTDSR
jgi:hypothetical protein